MPKLQDEVKCDFLCMTGNSYWTYRQSFRIADFAE